MAEGLTALVSKAVEIGSFQGYTINDNLRFSIMQFTDDTMMGKATWDNLWSIKIILRSFELVSGLNVNFHNRKFIGINISEDFMATAATFLNCRT